MSEALRRIARGINEELASGCKLVVGKIVKHPTHGRVKILSGCFLDPIYGRVSNFWEWKKVDRNGKPYGRTLSGYGWM